jgi:hypothetical protein
METICSSEFLEDKYQTARYPILGNVFTFTNLRATNILNVNFLYSKTVRFSRYT